MSHSSPFRVTSSWYVLVAWSDSSINNLHRLRVGLKLGSKERLSGLKSEQVLKRKDSPQGILFGDYMRRHQMLYRA